jgi:hypothetical protein
VVAASDDPMVESREADTLYSTVVFKFAPAGRVVKRTGERLELRVEEKGLMFFAYVIIQGHAIPTRVEHVEKVLTIRWSFFLGHANQHKGRFDSSTHTHVR